MEQFRSRIQADGVHLGKFRQILVADMVAVVGNGDLVGLDGLLPLVQDLRVRLACDLLERVARLVGNDKRAGAGDQVDVRLPAVGRRAAQVGVDGNAVFGLVRHSFH